MGISRATLVVTLLAVTMAALIALVVWDANRPLTGDWQSDEVFDESRFTLRLKRLATGPWSKAIPEIAERSQTLDRPSNPEEFYLFAEFELRIDGKPWRRVDANSPGMPNFRETELFYRGQKLQSHGSTALLPGTQPGSIVMAWGKVTSWKRGYGRGEMVVRQEISFERGGKIDAKFRFSAR